MEPEKCDDLRWFPLSALPKNLMHHVGLAIRDWRDGMPYSEVPFTEKFVNPNTK